ncbi:PASTA domain-containing protein [Corynebacterium pseudopelargi]|uniref:non-specific serine/threonine protein kinase n=1 Tax=Corynebacterium pseudopelargi TaxID=2080757 RepID=A0A3G6ITA1_9CORY|nr:PASTA domain-containing protein [Corynebacterium pseudopelargi]AZA08911.1 Serine/threonine-protein kinase PknL [Corynebacterium pseudopelargi]
MAELKAGDLLENRYRIEAPIAKGGMSTVYRCLDVRLGRLVAAKVMHEHYVEDPVFRQRFQREARSMAQLSHPCLVGVYDFSADGDEVFLVMELITGGTLRELLAERGPMPPHAAVAVMRQVLTGLAVAHDAGMIHRDLKPDNVLIHSDHSVKLADFGLVRAASAAQATSAQIVGTVSYLSPEQVSGEELTPASDVYSAGIVLFELLTGTTPFEGSSQIAHAYARLDQDVPAPSSRIAGVPPLIDELVGTATTRYPEERFANAEEFLHALEDVAAELALPAFKVPVPQNAAAHRASESMVAPIGPTDLLTTNIPREQDATEVFGTEVIDAPAGAEDATEIVPGTPAHNPHETQALFPDFQEESQDDPGEPWPESEQAYRSTAPETSVMPPVAGPTPAYSPAAYPPAHTPAPSPEYQQPAAQGNGGQDYIKPTSNRSGWKFAIWMILVALLTGAIAIGAWWFGSGRYGEIPQVLGLDQVEATAMVQDAGFSTIVEQEYSNEPADQVIGTRPEVGSKAVKGNNITLLVSQGQPTVPNVPPSRTIDDVTAALQQVTLSVASQQQEYDNDVPVGQVIATDPKAGTVVPANSQVRLKISKGPAPVKIPSVRGESAEQARKKLESAGLKVTESQEFSADEEAGDAFATEPPAGTAVPRDSSVTLKISTAIKIPDVEGMSQQEAERVLAEAGVIVSEVSRSDSYSGDRPDEVARVWPSPGTLVDPATAQVRMELVGEVKIPNVLNKKLGDAIQILEDAGFEVDASSGNNAARVYSQSPRGGSAPPGSTITLKVIGG